MVKVLFPVVRYVFKQQLLKSIVTLKFVLAAMWILVIVNKTLERICIAFDKFCKRFSILKI